MPLTCFGSVIATWGRRQAMAYRWLRRTLAGRYEYSSSAQRLRPVESSIRPKVRGRLFGPAT
jgi:hypothetical protein